MCTQHQRVKTIMHKCCTLMLFTASRAAGPNRAHALLVPLDCRLKKPVLVTTYCSPASAAEFASCS